MSLSVSSGCTSGGPLIMRLEAWEKSVEMDDVVRVS